MVSTTKPIPTFEDHERFLKFIRVDNISGCWEWIGNIKENGYGTFSIKTLNKTVTRHSHRVSMEIFKGPLDLKLIVDHECQNRKCVNPEHLRQVTSKINTHENSKSPVRLQSLVTHCPQGHEYTNENTRIRKNKRECLICCRASCMRSYYKKKEAVAEIN